MKIRFALLLLICSGAYAQSVPDVRGIYVYTNDVATIAPSVKKAIQSSLSVPGMDGIAIVIGWSAVEPSMGQYQWTLLDSWMDEAIAAGKKIDLVVTAGWDEPAWLFQPAPGGAGAKELDFTISPHSGATGQCQDVKIAAPWDTAFLGRWDTLLAAVAAHLKSNGTYTSVTLVRITGINRTTEEMRLPAETPQSTGLACVTDAIATWQAAGYKPSLLLHAWDSITASFQKSFPDKTFVISIIPTNPFPPIAEDGSIIKGTPPDENLPLMTLGAQRFPGRFIVQFDFLMPGEAASPAVVGYAQTLGTLASFQTNEYLGSIGQGAACSEPVTNPTPCTTATFLTLLETGIYPLGQSNPLRAQFIEVFGANADAFPGDVFQAHNEIRPSQERRRSVHK